MLVCDLRVLSTTQECFNLWSFLQELPDPPEFRLLFRKSTLLGALLMLPVMANIPLINVFILVNDYGPFLISGLICIFLLALLWHQRSALTSLLWRSQKCEPADSIRRHHWIRFGIVVVTLTMMLSGAIIQKHVRRSR